LREWCASNEPGPHPRGLLQALPVVRNFKLLSLRFHAIKKNKKKFYNTILKSATNFFTCQNESIMRRRTLLDDNTVGGAVHAAASFLCLPERNYCPNRGVSVTILTSNLRSCRMVS
jgi:hypothetical protein